LGNFTEVLRWTIKNDFVEPFPEIVFFILVLIVATNNFVSVGGTEDLFANLTWKTIIILIVLVGIGGTRSYSQALEKGETATEMLTMRVSRVRFAILKYFSVFLTLSGIILAVDFFAFFEFLGYFPWISVYSTWGSAPVASFVVMFLEQLVLLFLLNSLIILIAFCVKKSTVTLLVFFTFGLFWAMPSIFTPSVVPGYLQLGYGDNQIANQISQFVFVLLYRNTPAMIALTTPDATAILSFAYRGCVGALALIAAVQVFKWTDMDY